MLAAASADAWRWQAHVEVWVLVAGVVGLGWYAARVIGPKVVPPGREPVTRRQRGFFVAGVVLLWLASDWPVHDVAEEYLYAVHMVQHLLLTFVVPALFLLATPTWLARLVVPEGSRVEAVVRRLARPVVAALIFNVVVALSHVPFVVNATVETGPLHYLAIMSILPTIPAAWLTFAEGTVYSSYDTAFRLWGITVADDQQAAGLIMKLVGGFYLWGIIFSLFFRWSARHQAADELGVTPSERDVLLWDDVESEFDRLGPPQPETGSPDSSDVGPGSSPRSSPG
jgi:putative membrane protein